MGAKEDTIGFDFEVIGKEGCACGVCHGRIGVGKAASGKFPPGVSLGKPSFGAPAVNVCFTCLCLAAAAIGEDTGVPIIIASVAPVMALEAMLMSALVGGEERELTKPTQRRLRVVRGRRGTPRAR
jgi:hypothetical protein